MNRIVRALSSTTLAIVLCLVLAGVSVVGSLLYKGNTAFAYRGAFNIFRSPLVLVPAVLLTLNILFCAGRRLPAMGAGSVKTWTFAGMHAGLVLLTAGVVVDGAFGFLATQYYPVGTPLSVHFNWRTGREERYPFTVEVVSAEERRHPLRLRIGVRDAAGEKRGIYEVREGVPFRVAGSGLTVTPRAFDPDGKRLVFDAEAGGTAMRSIVAGPQGSPPTAGFVIVPVAFHEPEISDYVAKLRFSRPGTPPEEGVARINHPFVFEKASYCIADFNRDKYGNLLVGLQMTREPGEALFWGGGLLFVASLLGRLAIGRGGAIAVFVCGTLLAALPGEGHAAAGRTIAAGEAIWEGEIRVTAPVTVEKGGTLRIRPGTVVLLSGADRDGDGCRDGFLQVFGTLLVEGEEGRPVRFARLDGDAPWEEIFLKDATARIRHAVIEGGTWGLHIHEGRVEVERTAFLGNGGGVRLRGTGATFSRCTFRGNGVALRFWRGGPRVDGSVIEGNGTGLFYREGAGGGKISGSVISNREWDLKVGDWATGNLDLAGNYWGPAGRPKVMDFREDKGAGRIVLTPRLVAPPPP